jgi:hypothetical protein
LLSRIWPATSFVAAAGGKSQRGGIIGGGLEWSFLRHWSAKAEHSLRPSFGSTSPTDIRATLTEHNVSLFRFGVNFHFGRRDLDSPILIPEEKLNQAAARLLKASPAPKWLTQLRPAVPLPAVSIGSS